MARIYDVVCLNCGEIFYWCKYDPPVEKCPNCGEKLVNGEDWNYSKVRIFGVGSTGEMILEFSKTIKRRLE
jgi:uncharacterized OB-fold protein